MNFEGSQPVYLRKDLGKGVKEGFVSAFAIPVGEMQAKKRGIFEAYIDSDYFGRHLAHFGAVKLAMVCKTWRTKIDSMPRLWSKLYFMPPTCQGEVMRFETILSKTASLPIHLFFDAGNSQSLPSSITGPLISALRGPISAHAHQLATLDIEIEFPPDWLPPLVMKLFKTDLDSDNVYPKLTKVRLYIADPGTSDPKFEVGGEKFWYSFSEDSHHLKELTTAPGEWLLGYGLTVSKSYAWEQITRLDLQCVDSLRSILSPLRSCKELEYLNVQFSGNCDRAEGWLEKESLYREGAPLTIDLPHLKELRIQFSDRATATMFNALTLPNLGVVGLLWYSGVPSDDRKVTYDALNQLQVVVRSRCWDTIVDLNYDGDGYYETWA
ncbi:hypothetical protein FA13DRAFT_1905108 [Coprinellus micaceus]|uniref:F-box domain-containing protein n=1 Tax=Coprinellus micaceus TaxID=71717 RepID=A0A4Y7STF9_COPMI|nr:hypothetical protein FA13DRAFT_1905108 [Coprinellus micaceus]